MTPVSAPANTAASSKQTAADPTTPGDFQTFLTLLTTQLRHQDPLKPVESTEFVAQLASFSAVEQQVKTNARLEAIQTGLTQTQAQNLSGWIGREARTAGAFRFEGAPVPVEFDPPQGATSATVRVLNSDGSEVFSTPVSPMTTRWEWAGQTANGTAPADSAYRVEVTYAAGETVLETRAAESYSPVQEIFLHQGIWHVLLASGVEAAAADITALR